MTKDVISGNDIEPPACRTEKGEQTLSNPLSRPIIQHDKCVKQEVRISHLARSSIVYYSGVSVLPSHHGMHLRSASPLLEFGVAKDRLLQGSPCFPSKAAIYWWALKVGGPKKEAEGALSSSKSDAKIWFATWNQLGSPAKDVKPRLTGLATASDLRLLLIWVSNGGIPTMVAFLGFSFRPEQGYPQTRTRPTSAPSTQQVGWQGVVCKSPKPMN